MPVTDGRTKHVILKVRSTTTTLNFETKYGHCQNQHVICLRLRKLTNCNELRQLHYIFQLTTRRPEWLDSHTVYCDTKGVVMNVKKPLMTMP